LSETALIHATWEGNVEIVEALITANASLNIRERVSYVYNASINCVCVCKQYLSMTLIT